MSISITRRRFLATTASTAALGGLSNLAPSFVRRALAAEPTRLIAERRTIEVLRKPASVFGIRQPNGKPGLVTDVSTPFQVHLENDSGEPTLIHWHGLKPPYQQDGVPDVSGPLIPTRASADYDFPLAFSGTYWMHSHQGLQEQQLMTAPLIIHDADDRRRDEQEVVVFLHDFSFKSPEEIFAGLRKTTSSGAGMKMGGSSAMAGHQMPGAPSSGMSMNGMQSMPGMAHGSMPGMDGGDMHGADSGARGMKMDLNDVVYDAFLANDRTLEDPEVVRVEAGGRVLLRIINGASASNFAIDLGQLKAELVAVDGHPVSPVTASAFPIAMAQRLDLRVQLPEGQGAYPVLAVLEGERKRTGVVLATTQAMVQRIGDESESATGPLDFPFEQTLRAAAPLAARPADRVHHIDLTGSMEGYVWSLNGVTYDHHVPIKIAKGERVEIVMTNKTMMSHPMHLHGHVFQVIAVNDRRFPGANRDTVLVPPATSVTIAFDADNPGRWVFHCHNLYHMTAGMMTTVEYENY
jgi:FtsP/CotA-like multicopper oxidase with cupredoxin domain